MLASSVCFRLLSVTVGVVGVYICIVFEQNAQCSAVIVCLFVALPADDTEMYRKDETIKGDGQTLKLALKLKDS